MNNTQALQITKQIFDAALQKGIIDKIENANAMIQAYNFIQQALLKQNDAATN